MCVQNRWMQMEVSAEGRCCLKELLGLIILVTIVALVIYISFS